MTVYYLNPLVPFFQALTDAGVVVPNGLIWTYVAGTTTPTATYTDITGGTANANPIQLGSNGRLTAGSIWQPGGAAIKVIFTTNAGTSGAPVFGTQLGITYDQLSGINDPAALLTTLINPASGSGADLIANAMRSYDLVATVRAANVPSLATGQTLIIDLEGGSTINDGGGGLFYWNATSTATDDGGISTIKPTAAGATGRYIRLTVPAGTAGTFTLTLLGVTGAPTTTAYYSLAGGPALGLVTVSVTGQTGTSNSTGFSLSGWPSGLCGLTESITSPLLAAEDNSAIGAVMYATIPPVSGSVILTINNATSNWTASGTKGFQSFSFSYLLK